MSAADADDAAGSGSGGRPVYSIGAVVKMVGIDATTLRSWEDRYQVVVPLRSRGGQRLYSRDDLEHLRFVLAEMEKGSSPADAHRLLAEKLQSLDALTPPEPEGPTVVILLAERDRYAAELSEYFLRTEGYEVCVAFDPRAAERLLAERHPDLSVVELMLSGGGVELCRRLAQSSDAPVLALSALDLADEALSAGASAFVSKPIDPLQFVSTVRDLLGQSRADEAVAGDRLLVERVSTGNARLDAVLGGGLVANAITFVVGAPGSGKTILAEQCVFANATSERPGLYLSTASEPFDKLLRYGQSLEFFDVTEMGRSVFYDDLGDALTDEGLTAVLDRVDALVKEHRPALVVIDSFRALKAFAADEAEFRRFLRDIAGRFTALAVSSIWVGEYVADDAADSPEFAVADAVIALETRRTGERSIRLLSVRKLRGSDFLSGDHLYRITPAGLSVFPRLADPRDGGAYAPNEERVPTGVAALDESLEDGYWPGSTTLVAGPSGIGKTLMGLHFLFGGGKEGEPGILLTLQENRRQLARIIARFGWSIDDPNVTVLDRSPVDVYLDELVYELLDRIETLGARRVVIDSLGDLVATVVDRARFDELIYSLVQRCSHMGVSLMFTYEILDLFQINRVSDVGLSHIADNVVLLQHVQDGANLKRSLTVLKSRASDSARTTREFHISREGITLGDPIDPRSFRAT